MEYSDALAHPCHSFLTLLAFIPLIARQILFFPDSMLGYVPKLAFDARIGRYASAALVVLVLIVGIVALSPYVYADTMGNTTATGMSIATNGSGQIELARFTAASTGALSSITILVPSPSGNGNVGIYTDSSGSPGALIAQGSQQALSAQVTFTISGSITITQGTSYWLAFETQSTSYYFSSGGSSVRGWASGACCTLPNTVSAGKTSGSYAIYATYVTGPPPSDFTIAATTGPQTIGAGATATYTLSITYSPTLTTTVNLVIASGCPTGVTCTVTPNSVSATNPSITLSVPTLITTPGGTISINVTATSTVPPLAHSVIVQLTINPPGSYPVNVHTGATQIVVTVTWTAATAASVTLVGPGNTPTLSESAAVVYDRVTFASGSLIPTNIHRVTFTLSPSPSAPQTWTVLVSLSGSYTVAVEVS